VKPVAVATVSIGRLPPSSFVSTIIGVSLKRPAAKVTSVGPAPP
jgi:hypothetical protein